MTFKSFYLEVRDDPYTLAEYRAFYKKNRDVSFRDYLFLIYNELYSD